jgi:sugar lactone lactonase YvrE
MTDQSGAVYRLGVNGKLDTLLSNGISPNGLVLSPDQKVSQLLRKDLDIRCYMLQ